MIGILARILNNSDAVLILTNFQKEGHGFGLYVE